MTLRPRFKSSFCETDLLGATDTFRVAVVGFSWAASEPFPFLLSSRRLVGAGTDFKFDCSSTSGVSCESSKRGTVPVPDLIISM